MKHQSAILASALIACITALSIYAEPEPNSAASEINREIHGSECIQMENIEAKSQGRIAHLSIILSNGRIGEMLIAAGSSGEERIKIAAVPKDASAPDPLNKVSQQDVATEATKSASETNPTKRFDLPDKANTASPALVPTPYFLEETAMPSRSTNRRRLLIDSVGISNGIVRLLVGNLRNQRSGEVYSMALDVRKGRVRSFTVRESVNSDSANLISLIAITAPPLLTNVR
jgi:hypothetical protein